MHIVRSSKPSYSTTKLWYVAYLLPEAPLLPQSTSGVHFTDSFTDNFTDIRKVVREVVREISSSRGVPLLGGLLKAPYRGEPLLEI